MEDKRQFRFMLNGMEFDYISFIIKPCDYETKYMIVEIEYFAKFDCRKVKGNINDGLKTTQGFIVDKMKD